MYKTLGLTLFAAVWLGACTSISVAVTDQPEAALTPSSPAEPVLPSPTAATPTNSSGFAIYLYPENVSPQQLATKGPLERAKDPLLSTDDIISYRKATHEIELTDTGYEKMHDLSVPTNGIAFTVCVNGQPIYDGAFWTALSSLSFDGVVIEVTRLAKENPVIQIELGYPGPDFFGEDDPRSDPAILQALEQTGKLR